MSTDPTHQGLRELLGAYVLGHLNEDEVRLVGAHLDGCADCRAELAILRPLAEQLAQVDPESFASAPTPPPDLGHQIKSAIAAERALRDRVVPLTPPTQHRRTTRRPYLVAAAAISAVALGGGVLIGRVTAPDTSPSIVATETISLVPMSGTAIRIDRAELINHTWGSELRIVANGFTSGATVQAAFQNAEGQWVPAGEFLGVGSANMTCNLQSAGLRDDLTAVALMDAGGKVLATADL